jgi:hypothetical protein
VLLIVLCSLLVAGCYDGGSHAASTTPKTVTQEWVDVPTPPNNHGGYSGAEAKAYDAAYIACYKAAAKASAQGGDSLVAVPVPPGHAASKGCRRGTHAVLGPSVPPVTPNP